MIALSESKNTINNNAIDKNQPINTTVGTFTTTDPDTGDPDNNLFTIDGNTLKTNSIFDFETQTFYNIRVQTLVVQ